MTSSETSRNDLSEKCPNCGGPMVTRPAHRFPIWTQIVFALSFVMFLFLFEKAQAYPPILWAWSAFQVFVGVLLMRGRLRARQRILRCIRCTPAVR